MMSDASYSFWLVPQARDLKIFQATINSLAKRFGTVPFCPHVTLYSGPLPTSSSVETLLTTTLSMTTPIKLDVLGLSYGLQFAKTFYVQLALSPVLQQLVNQLVSNIPNAQPPVLDPHLSLLYHHLDPEIQQILAETVSLSRSTIWFDQVQAIAAPRTFETQAHVKSLRCVHNYWLTPS